MVCFTSVEDTVLSAHPDRVTFGTVERADGRLLITSGLCRYAMNVPATLHDESTGYAEFALLLPKNEQTDDSHPAVKLLSNISERVRHGQWLSYGHVIPFSDCPPFVAATMYPLIDPTSGFDSVICCPDGRIVTVYLLILLNAEELDYRLSTDGAALHSKITTLVTDPERKSFI